MMCVSLQRNIALGDRMKRVCEQKDEATTDLLSSSTTESTENPTVHILKVFLRDGYFKKKRSPAKQGRDEKTTRFRVV
jgi:hypothetical protein